LLSLLFGEIEMKLLSFDQAMNLTGYAVFTKSKLKKFGLIDCHNLSGDERLQKMISEIYALIDLTKPDFVVVENVQSQANMQAVIMLARLQGAIIGYCFKKNIPWKMYLPTQWRKLIGIRQGKGIKRAELKAQSLEFVKTITKEPVNEDVAEAISIGCAYLKELKDLEEK